MVGAMDGKVAIVTGAGSGIGQATALTFARAGAKVVVADWSVAGGEETVALIRKAGGTALFVRTDVSQNADVEAVVGRTVAEFGRLDYAFNNAGVADPGNPVAEYKEADWDRVMNISLKGIFLSMKHETAQMLKQGGGAIVNNASVFGLKATPGYVAYCAAKHGTVAITKVAALDYAKSNIRVNAVCPGMIETPMMAGALQGGPDHRAFLESFNPIGRMGQPQEVANLVVWLCSDAASLMTGAIISVDGAAAAQ